jgi:hypothetical protein
MTQVNHNLVEQGFCGSIALASWRYLRTHATGHRVLGFTAQEPLKALELLAERLGLGVEMTSPTGGYASGPLVFIAMTESNFAMYYHTSIALEALEAVIDIKPANPEHRVKWWFMTKDGPNSRELLLKGYDPHDAFYPWMSSSLDEFAEDFSLSTANVLLLVGPPGTGKTSFIRGLVRRMRYETWVTYDQEVQNNEEFYVDFASPRATVPDSSDGDAPKIEHDDRRCLVMEDSDELLVKRSAGNKLMNRILSLSDGITTLPQRKVIFSTNLPGLKSIDEALLRPGRCFAAVRFRDLSMSEAKRAAAAIGVSVSINREFMSLSQALNAQQVSELEAQTIGFT